MRFLMMWLVGCGGSETPDEPKETCVESEFYADADGDGYGDPFASESSCDAPEGHVDNREDCDDDDAGEYPGLTWYRDVDGDGFGDEEQSLVSCHQPVGYIAVADDCDDSDGTRYPGAQWYLDADEDGFGDAEASLDACGEVGGAVPDSTDCDDAQWLTHPGANEVCDGIDNDCDDLVDDEDDGIDIFTQVPVFVDEDGDGYGSEESLGRACADSSTGAPISGDCDDTNAAVHPHRLDYNDDVDADCDGVTDVFTVSSSEGGWLGPIASTGFGLFMDAKDIDGDGRNELITGGYNYDAEEDNIGAVFFIPGGIDGDQSEWPIDEGRGWVGDLAEGKLGYGLAFAGDWDGDGVEDIVAGAPYHNENGGIAYIFSSEMEEETIAGAHLAMEFYDVDSYWGQSMIGLGDIDSDGLDDALISARKDSTAGNNRGSVTVVLGGSDEAGSLTIHGASNGDQFGYKVANAGDVDGDGIADVLVGAPYGDEDEFVNGGGDVLLISVVDLLAATPITEDTPVFYGNQQGGAAGIDVAGAGDFNGDGLDDVLIGACNYDLDEELDGDEGAAYLILGSSDGWESGSVSEAHLTMYGGQFGGKFGRYLGAPGDISGDGLADVFVTTHNWDGEDSNMGLTSGVLGGHEGGILEIETDADVSIIGDGTNDYLGRAIVAAGDTNEDGVGDVWMGASGAGSTGTVYLIEGAPMP